MNQHLKLGNHPALISIQFRPAPPGSHLHNFFSLGAPIGKIEVSQETRGKLNVLNSLN